MVYNTHDVYYYKSYNIMYSYTIACVSAMNYYVLQIYKA